MGAHKILGCCGHVGNPLAGALAPLCKSGGSMPARSCPKWGSGARPPVVPRKGVGLEGRVLARAYLAVQHSHPLGPALTALSHGSENVHSRRRECQESHEASLGCAPTCLNAGPLGCDSGGDPPFCCPQSLPEQQTCPALSFWAQGPPGTPASSQL